MGDNYRSARCVFGDILLYSTNFSYFRLLVGNIPYDATEQQLIEVFQQAGPVVSFRLVFDRDTGKPKGYGFCEYRDVETALSAMRNLNNYEFNGRQLRVDFADQGGNQPSRQHGGQPASTLTNAPNVNPSAPATVI